MSRQEDRILVVAQAWVGDITFSQILYAQLRADHPQSQIDVAAPRWASSLLHRMPEVAHHWIADIPHGRLKPIRQWQLARQWRGRYRHAIIVPRSAKAALAPALAGIPRRTGFAASGRAALINDARHRPEDLLGRMLSLAGTTTSATPSPPRPQLQTDAQAGRNLMQRLGLESGCSWVGLMPGAAFGPAKQWGIDSFAKLAALLDTHNYRLCIIGGPDEQKIGERIAENTPGNIVNLCGRLELDETIDLISALDGAVCNDSGLLHIAAAVDTPVVGIYGSTSPDTHPPMSSRASVCYARYLCSPCHRRRCPYGHHACMTAITPEQVLDEILKVMQG